MATTAITLWESLADEDVLAQARAGSKEAVQDLIRRNKWAIRRVCRQWLNPRCLRLYDPDDVLQEIQLDFLTRAIHPEALATPQAFFNYGLRSAVQKCLEINRRWLKGKRRQLEREAGQLAVEPADGHSGEWLEKELAEEALEIGFRQRDVVADIYLMAFQKGTPEQIAKITGKSLRTVYRLLALGERRLRQGLEKT